MSFLFKRAKKELDITDALIRKEAKITIGGKSVVIKACKLVKALELIESLSAGIGIAKLIGTDLPTFNKYLLNKLPIILDFCEIKDIKAEDITLAEFSDLLLAIYCVNDLERIIANFTKAVQSVQIVQIPSPKIMQTMQGSATSPKQ